MKPLKLMFAMALVLANSAMAGNLVQTASFEQDQLSVHATDGYQVITVPGYPTSSELGKPSLPQVVQSILLPAGAVLTGVQVVSADEVPLPGEFLIAPAQHARPLPMPGKSFNYPKIEPDKTTYGADRKYPEALVRSLGTGTMCGYSIAQIEISPVRYNPVTRTAYLARRLRYSVTYRENAEPAWVPTQHQKEVFGQAVRSAVVNAGDVDRFAPPVRSQNSSKSLPSGQFKYVIISGSTSFDTVFARLAAWKTSKGVRDTVIPVAWITSNYAGYDNTEKIRNFIVDAKNTWGTVYVLLGGQGDDKNSGQNLIPARHAYYTTCGAGYYSDENQIPSDLYYSDLDGTWDADGDHTYGELADNANLYPDVFVGRAPVLTVAQAQNFVAKVLKYEQAPPTGYLKKMLLPTAILWSSYEERPTQRYIAAMTPSGWTDDSLFERRSTLSQSAMVASMNAGRGLGHWMGHGDENGIYMGSSAFYSSSTADAASNGDKQGVHISIACFTGAMDEVSGGDCFAEHIINRSGGGAVGVIMNSRYGWGAYVGGYVMGPSEMIDTTFMHRIFYDGLYRQGEMLASAKTAWVPYADQSNQYSYMRWCLYELNLFGDPELPIWTEEADSMRLTYNATLPTGSGSYSVTVKNRSNVAISGALVCLRTKSNALYATGTTNSSGVASITINPAAAETLFISATARNKLAAFGKALITGTATPTLAVSMSSWSVAAAGGTSSTVNVTNSGSTSVIAYTVSDDATWLTTSAASGNTPGSFTMTAAANTTTSSRTATVTVTATTSGVSGSPKTITVTQAAAATPTLAVSMSSWAPAAAGGTSGTVSVTNSGSTSVIAYTVASNQSWLTVSSSSGSTPGSFTMTAAANTSTSSRSATVTVTATTSGVSGSPKTIAVTQAAATSEVTIFSDNMTSFPTGWTLSPTSGGWTKTSTKYYSSSYSAMGDNISPYGTNQANYMTRTVSLSGYSSASLSFYIWQYTESNYDYIYVQYSTNGGTSYTTAWSRSGSYQSWSKQTVSIPTTANRIRFYFKSDYSVQNTGVYIDDVVLTAKSGGTTPNYTKSTATYSWVATSTALGLSGDDAYKAVSLPFTFNFYGTNYTSVNVCTNGFLNFGTSSTAYSPAAIPSAAAPNALMAALWRDLNADASTSITYSSSTSQFVVSYGNIKNYSNTSRQTFQVILTPDGKIKYQWQTVTNDVTTSIGVENQGGTLGVSHTGPTSGSAILFTPPASWVGLPLLAGEFGQDQIPVFTELLSQNFPNPFVGRTTFFFSLPDTREASLRVYNVSGQLVRTLAEGTRKAGHHKLEWDAKDDYGRPLANGTYIYRLEAGDLSATRKMVILK